MINECLNKVFKGRLCEAICVTLDALGRPNTAPMGVRYAYGLYGGSLILNIYPETHTIANLTRIHELTINLTNNVILFYKSLFEKDKIKFRASDIVSAPIIVDEEPTCSIECEVMGLSKLMSESFIVIAKPLVVHGTCPPPETLNRASKALLEALIKITKIKSLKRRRDPEFITDLTNGIVNDIELVISTGDRELKEVADNLLLKLWELAADRFQYRVEY